MNVPFYIARRYFLSPHHRTFINIIALISMGVVAVGTMALIVGLSVFNGGEHLLRSRFGAFDPDLRILPREGKSFTPHDTLYHVLDTLNGIAAYSLVLEDYALARYQEAETVVKIRGINPRFLAQSGLDKYVVRGHADMDAGQYPYALIGEGVQYTLSLSMHAETANITLRYPTRHVSFDPQRLYRQAQIRPIGVFAINYAYDGEYMLVPLSFARTLLDAPTQTHTIDLRLQPDAAVADVQHALQQQLGTTFVVRTREQLHDTIYRILRIEKLFVFIIFVFILCLASCSLFFTLSMLVLNKQQELALLHVLGATRRHVRAIFLFEGGIISAVGGGVGLGLGLGVCYVQQRFGLISLGLQTAAEQAYPVRVDPYDVLWAIIGVMSIAFVAAFRPAYVAGRMAMHSNKLPHSPG